MPVYLLHSTVPLVRSDGVTVRHYLGYCDPGGLANRLTQHRTGRHSAKILLAMRAKGASFLLGAFWPQRTREDERRMKRNGHLGDQCLVCQLKRSVRAYDALLSEARRSSDISPRRSPPRGSDSPPQSGPGATAETVGLWRLRTQLQYIVSRARRLRSRGTLGGTSASSVTAPRAMRATPRAGTRR